MAQGRGRLPSSETHKLEGLAHEAKGAKGHPSQTKSGLGFVYDFITWLLAFILRAHGSPERVEPKTNYVDDAALAPGSHEVECKLLSGGRRSTPRARNLVLLSTRDLEQPGIGMHGSEASAAREAREMENGLGLYTASTRLQ